MKANVNFAGLSEAIQKWISRTVFNASAGGVVVGLSGGIDSAVAAALASRALGAENVLGLIMPCRSSQEDTDDGIRIADHLKVDHRTVDLSPVLDSFIKAGGLEETSVMNTANIKSRLRMAMLYANSTDRLVLGTGNYSEIQVGYWTKWGDGAADLLPLGRLYKEEIRKLAELLELPGWIISRVPSAGLWPGQSDEGEMGVSYSDIQAYFEGTGVSEAAAERIQLLSGSSEHKRNPISCFEARKWMESND
jgi:NAD+ synthase